MVIMEIFLKYCLFELKYKGNLIKRKTENISEPMYA